MIIAHSDKDIEEYMAIITSHMIENPVLIDKYMMGTEVEVDAICDGKDFLIPGIMEHVERAGVHPVTRSPFIRHRTSAKRLLIPSCVIPTAGKGTPRSWSDQHSVRGIQ